MTSEQIRMSFDLGLTLRKAVEVAALRGSGYALAHDKGYYHSYCRGERARPSAAL